MFGCQHFGCFNLRIFEHNLNYCPIHAIPFLKGEIASQTANLEKEQEINAALMEKNQVLKEQKRRVIIRNAKLRKSNLNVMIAIHKNRRMMMMK